MERWPFCGGSYTLQSPIAGAEKCMNLYPEQPESQGSTTAMTLMHTPGLVTKYQLPETAVPAIFEVNGRTFAAGANFYELFANLTFDNYGALNGPPLTPTQIFSCQTHLLIQSNGDLFIFVLTTFTDSNNIIHAPNTLVPVDMAQFNGPVLQIDFCDGYFCATIQNSNSFQVSNLEDGTTWSGLFISTISYFPDNIVSMKVDHRNIGFLSGKKSIIYYNSGAGFPPFIPIQGAFLEDGCAATFATVQAADTVCWLSQSERGPVQAKILSSGTAGQRISTLATEFAWQSYTTVADAIGYTYQDQGHMFWVIRFPTANATWVFDFLTQYWHERGFWKQSTGQFLAHRSTSHAFAFGMHLVGDWASGNIYQMTIDTYTDFGNAIRWLRRGPMMMVKNKWLYILEIEFILETGLGLMPPLLDGDGQPRAPQVMFRLSRDGSKTWGNEFLLDCGQAGEYNVRVRKVMLGRGRKMVPELSGTDPIPWRIIDSSIRVMVDGEQVYN